MESFGEKEDSPRPNWLWGIRQVLLNGELLEVPARIKEESLDTSFLRWIPIEKGYEEADFALQVARLAEAAYNGSKTHGARGTLRREERAWSSMVR